MKELSEYYFVLEPWKLRMQMKTDKWQRRLQTRLGWFWQSTPIETCRKKKPLVQLVTYFFLNWRIKGVCKRNNNCRWLSRWVKSLIPSNKLDSLPCLVLLASTLILHSSSAPSYISFIMAHQTHIHTRISVPTSSQASCISNHKSPILTFFPFHCKPG